MSGMSGREDNLTVIKSSGEKTTITAKQLKQAALAQGLSNFMTILVENSEELHESIPGITRALNLGVAELRVIGAALQGINNSLGRLASAVEQSAGITQPVDVQRMLTGVMSTAFFNAAVSLESASMQSTPAISVPTSQVTTPDPERRRSYTNRANPDGPPPQYRGRMISEEQRSNPDSRTKFILDHFPTHQQDVVYDAFTRLEEAEERLGRRILKQKELREEVPRVEARFWNTKRQIWNNFREFLDTYELWKEAGQEIIVNCGEE